MRVVIAEDHVLVRAGLRLLLEAMAGVEVVAEAGNGLDALRLIGELRPDVVLMDLVMPGLRGVDAIRRAAGLSPTTRVLVVSMHADEAHVHSALAAGAAGYVLKGGDAEELENALRTVARGQRYLTPGISEAIVAAFSRGSAARETGSPLDALTERQLQVLKQLAEGASTKRIADRLGISVKTVETHRSAIMQRLGIADLAGLVRFAVREGLVDREL